MPGNRKWEAIDLLKLYTHTHTDAWNAWLQACLDNRDIQLLQKTMYGLQAGMTDLANDKLNDDKIINWFLRMTKSIEITAKKIFRDKYPNPLDKVGKNRNIKKLFGSAFLAKKKRDMEFESWLKGCRF